MSGVAEEHTDRKAPRYPIESVSNALRLLLMLRDEPQIRLTQASAALGVALSTAHRLLAMLEYHGFVRNDESLRAYVAGPALTDIGLAVVQKMDIRRAARPILEQLRAESGETVHLAALDGVSVLFLDCVESSRELRATARTGRALPAHCTAVGKAILAAFTNDELDRLYPADDLPPRTDRSIRTRAELRKELRDVRQRDYASNIGESEALLGSVAVSLPHQIRGRFVGISLAAPLNRLDPAKAAPQVAMLRRARDALTARLRPALG
ncbi:IclR family transcriptional regulator [Acrocarpospora corrugata]|uniref:IclR family transcriptional regulator n=1 Tax=Acrocarpospora corrugata TaxID=35763 RepID=A0A5M3W226_9ACTN|nr:IclR family transcriptional regulator [Acrocarpospora corrugata]GES02756.1 IclR family transcriptional regulator [Acrocarpospora corrugata]